MNDGPTISDVISALSGMTSATSSDFDLNADVKGLLPKERKLRPAAVLVGLLERPSGVQVILTKRASHLKHHPGQIAFPGGKVEAEDTTVAAAAIREANEEIGLPPASVDLVGVLPMHETITGFEVTPVIGHITESFSYLPEAGEVEDVFEVPLSHLMKVGNYQIQGRVWQRQMRYYYVIPYGPYYIWGATARMLRSFADGMNV